MKKGLLPLIGIFLIMILAACGGQNGFTEDDLVFSYNGESFKLDSDASALISALGDDYNYKEAASCAYVGMDKSFSYNGIDIYTYPLDDIDKIDEIYISSDAYSTNKGITVGSTLDDIKAAYGENYTDLGGGMLVIAPEGTPEDTSSPCLYFIMDGETVIEFSFYSASNRNS